MASSTKITKAIRKNKKDKRTKNRQRRVKSLVQVRVEQLKALELAIK